MNHATRAISACIGLCAMLPGLPAAASGRPADTRPSLCAAEEVAIFSCALKTGRIVSLCASPDLSETAGSLRYLYGRKGAVELVHPAPGTAPRDAFTRGIMGGQGGDFIRFKRGGISYTLTSIILRDRGEFAGLKVEQAGKTLLESDCRDYALGAGAFGLLYRAKLPDSQYFED